LTIIGIIGIIEMRNEQMTKINISMSSEILAEIDELSKKENMTRSELLRTAFKTYVEVLAEKKKERQKQEGIERAIRIQDEIRSQIGNVDLIKELRTWREKRK
jgi:metal-responsive CopG/Arc/MetJ family transcriptional regulator